MITPIEIQNKSFKSGGLGYDKKDVDQFIREVMNSYESIYRENVELKDKLTVLNDGIQYYKTIEKTLQKALVLAEKTAEETKEAAVKKARVIEKEAHTKSQLIIADAKNELEHIHSQTIQMIQQYDLYKAQFKSLAASQLELLESNSFQINVARLDAFVEVTSGSKELEKKSATTASKTKDEFWKNPIKDLELLGEVENEIEEANPEEIIHNNDMIEGQEEFDFINLEDEEV